MLYIWASGWKKQLPLAFPSRQSLLKGRQDLWLVSIFNMELGHTCCSSLGFGKCPFGRLWGPKGQGSGADVVIGPSIPQSHSCYDDLPTVGNFNRLTIRWDASWRKNNYQPISSLAADRMQIDEKRICIEWVSCTQRFPGELSKLLIREQ